MPAASISCLASAIFFSRCGTLVSVDGKTAANGLSLPSCGAPFIRPLHHLRPVETERNGAAHALVLERVEIGAHVHLLMRVEGVADDVDVGVVEQADALQDRDLLMMSTCPPCSARICG